MRYSCNRTHSLLLFHRKSNIADIQSAYFVRDLFDDTAYLNNASFVLFQFTALYLMLVGIYSSLFIKIFQKIFTVSLLYFSASVALFFVL